MKKEDRKGLYHHVRQLIVLLNKLGITHVLDIIYDEIISKIKSIYSKRTKIKKIADSLNLECITQLALAKEEVGELKAAVFLRNMSSIES